jgi:phage terminase large subunit
MRAPERLRRTRAKTLFSDLHARAVEPLVEAERGSGWPLVQWQGDPAGFAREVLGVTLMPHQIAFLEAIRDREKVAVRSGQKTGKTKTIIVAALWFFCCFPKARVIMTANTKEQVRNVLWKELRDTLRESRLRIEGKWSDAPGTGFRATDGRELFGITARDIESMAGVSGGAMLFLVDEASALPQSKAEALEGNRAGSGMQRMVWISNPTRAEGPFFEAFHANKEYWATFHWSSEEVSAWQVANDVEIPGTANARRIAQWREEYGPESPFYLVRVKGAFLLHEGGKAITLHMIQLAQQAWADAEEEGELGIGIDPAGPGEGGDETAFAIVRGRKLLGLFTFQGITEDAIVEHLTAFLRTYRNASDLTPRVTIDSEGPIGSKLFYRLRAIAEGIKDPSKAFAIYGVRASQPARREPLIYERTRDELIACLARWMREGGAIPSDHKLEVELHAADWHGTVSGKLRLTAKEDIRQKIGRSPDRRDALALAVWRSMNIEVLIADQLQTRTVNEPRDLQDAAYMYDQQSGNDIWWPEG